MRLRTGRLSVLIGDNLDEAAQSAWLKTAMDLTSRVFVPPRKLVPAFLDAVDPQVVVLFVGSGERAKPSAAQLQALEGTTVLRTDERGTVELVVEGEGVRVRRER